MCFREHKPARTQNGKAKAADKSNQSHRLMDSAWTWQPRGGWGMHRRRHRASESRLQAPRSSEFSSSGASEGGAATRRLDEVCARESSRPVSHHMWPGEPPTPAEPGTANNPWRPPQMLVQLLEPSVVTPKSSRWHHVLLEVSAGRYTGQLLQSSPQGGDQTAL